MKVYLVLRRQPHGGMEIFGAFTTREAAENYAKPAAHDHHEMEFVVHEIEVVGAVLRDFARDHAAMGAMRKWPGLEVTPHPSGQGWCIGRDGRGRNVPEREKAWEASSLWRQTFADPADAILAAAAVLEGKSNSTGERN